jgi:hypothetical protein
MANVKLLMPSKTPTYKDLAPKLVKACGLSRLIVGHDALHFYGTSDIDKFHRVSQIGEIIPTYTERQLQERLAREGKTGYSRWTSFNEMENKNIRYTLANLNARDLNDQLFKHSEHKTLDLAHNGGVIKKKPYKHKMLKPEFTPEILPGEGFVLKRVKVSTQHMDHTNEGLQNNIYFEPKTLSHNQMRRIHNKWIRHAWQEEAINGPLQPVEFVKIPHKTKGTIKEVPAIQKAWSAFIERRPIAGLPKVDHGFKKQCN